MKLAAVVVLLAVASVALAADVDEVTEDEFTSADAVKTVHSVDLELNPQSAIPATIVEHLPSHNDESEESEIKGNAFETSNFEADVVGTEDSLVDSDGFVDADTTEVEEVEAEAPRFSSQPIRQLKAMLQMRSAAAPVPLPSMNAVPPKADKVASANNKLDLDSLAERAPPGQKKPLLDPEAERASHLYLGYEDPNHLPVGGLKIPVDYSGTIGTEAGDQFNYAKALKDQKLRAAGKRVKHKRCAKVALSARLLWLGIAESKSGPPPNRVAFALPAMRLASDRFTPILRPPNARRGVRHTSMRVAAKTANIRVSSIICAANAKSMRILL